jgi:hypothetical protein
VEPHHSGIFGSITHASQLDHLHVMLKMMGTNDINEGVAVASAPTRSASWSTTSRRSHPMFSWLWQPSFRSPTTGTNPKGRCSNESSTGSSTVDVCLRKNELPFVPRVFELPTERRGA